MDWGKITADKLLELLDNGKVQKRIQQIALAGLQQNSQPRQNDNNQEDISELSSLKATIAELERQKADWESQKEQLEALLQHQSKGGKEKVAKLQQKVEELEGQLKKATSDLKTCQIQARQYLAKLEKDLEQKRAAVGELQNENEKLQRSLARAEQSHRELEMQLQECKESSWQGKLADNDEKQLLDGLKLYNQVLQLPRSVRNHLETVFPEDSLLSFLGGIAQEDALESIWEELFVCYENEQQQEVNVLWELFQYALQMVNAVKGARRYEYLPVKEGQEYDANWMEIDRSGNMQGRVREVEIPGYYNTYSKKIIKRSYVRLG